MDAVYLVRERGVVHFISGGALGVDTWAMEAVLDHKTVFPYITLECALPYAEMPDRFSFEDRNRYDAIVKRCDIKTVVCPAYTGRDCLDKRDEYMVDHAGYLIAVWLGIMTGTGRTVEYARKLGREVFCYDFTRDENDIGVIPCRPPRLRTAESGGDGQSALQELSESDGR